MSALKQEPTLVYQFMMNLPVLSGEPVELEGDSPFGVSFDFMHEDVNTKGIYLFRGGSLHDF